MSIPFTVAGWLTPGTGASVPIPTLSWPCDITDITSWGGAEDLGILGTSVLPCGNCVPVQKARQLLKDEGEEDPPSPDRVQPPDDQATSPNCERQSISVAFSHYASRTGVKKQHTPDAGCLPWGVVRSNKCFPIAEQTQGTNFLPPRIGLPHGAGQLWASNR